MLGLFCLYIYIFLTSVAFGSIIVALFLRTSGKQSVACPYPCDILSVLGFAGITTVFSIYSLFCGLGGLLPHVILLCISLLSFLCLHGNTQQNMRNGLSFKSIIMSSFVAIPFFAGIVIFALQSPLVYDSALYHAQAIQWIEKLPVVKGLGNLNGRLAFNSSFFIPSALYGFSFVGQQTYYPLNSYFSILFVVRAIIAIKNSLTRNYAAAFMYASLLLISFFFLRIHSSSPSTDALPLILLFYLFVLFEWFSNDARAPTYLLIVILSFFLVTVKVSYIGAICLPLLYFYLEAVNRNTKNYLWSGLAATIIVFPWLIRNILLSGYIVYPFPTLDIFDVDWKIPLDWTICEINWIKSCAISWKESPHNVLQLPFSEWITLWWRDIPLPNKILTVCSIISPVVLVTTVVKKKIRRELFFFWLTCFISLCIWFVSAPDIRFVYGFMILCTAITVYGVGSLLPWSGPKQIGHWFLPALALLGLLITIYPLVSGSKIEGFSARQLMSPHQWKQAATVEKRIAGGMLIKVGTKGTRCKYPDLTCEPYLNQGCLCFNEEIPCAPCYNPRLLLRGSNIKEGFRTMNKH